jgi:glucosamine kinase
MIELVAGIDGGQSSTIAVIGDERGAILGRGVAGPADEVGEKPDSTRLRDALRDSLDRARAAAGLPKTTRFVAIVAGISGYEGRIYGAQPDLATDRLVLTHDAPIAHAGALAGEPGVVVIAGTGSVVYAVDQRGRSKMFGGWGYLFGDEGSAFYIAREALVYLMHQHDGGLENGSAQVLQAAPEACAFFGVDSLRELARAFYSGQITRSVLASYAPEALKVPLLRKIARNGARQLARFVQKAAGGSAAPKIALLGGVFIDDRTRHYLCKLIMLGCPGAQIVEPVHEPAAGALLLAYRELGLHVPELRK